MISNNLIDSEKFTATNKQKIVQSQAIVSPPRGVVVDDFNKKLAQPDRQTGLHKGAPISFAILVSQYNCSSFLAESLYGTVFISSSL